MAETKEKKYIIDNSALMAEWDWEKNEILPTKITFGSRVDAYWHCIKCNRVYKMRVNHRTAGHGCPYCSGRRATEDNNLSVVNPDLTSEWHPTKNGGLRPNDVLPNSSKIVWWKCVSGHEWQASIANRNSRKSGCPYCSGREAFEIYNLQKCNPTLAQEWHPTKNGELMPEQVTPSSHLVVWWMCEKGHSWKASIYHRNNNRGCPICSKELHTSFPEQAIYYYISQLFADTINSYKSTTISEIDIFIPSLKIGIEYNGYFWHKEKSDLDERKRMIIQNEGIVLYRVIEDKNIEKVNISGNDILFNPKNDYQFLDLVIQDLIKLIFKGEVPFSIDSKKDRYEIWSQYISLEKEHSFARKYPNIASEWHPTKNGVLSPEMVSPSSAKKVWWKCSKGHEWQALISNRAKGKGCPYCSGRFTTFDTSIAKQIQSITLCESREKSQTEIPLHNVLLEEWDYEKNISLSPSSLSPHSNQKVWWKCKICGHSWKTSVSNRTNGTSCPVCANTKRANKHSICVNSENIVANHPNLMSEWSHKNTINPNTTSVFSHKKALWQCVCGHEWEAEIKSRFMGNKCPYCANRKILIGFNDLATTHPELALEWDYESNTELTPKELTRGSGKKVWWKCKFCGFHWQASVLNRVSGTGCPNCQSRRKK